MNDLPSETQELLSRAFAASRSPGGGVTPLALLSAVAECPSDAATVLLSCGYDLASLCSEPVDPAGIAPISRAMSISDEAREILNLAQVLATGASTLIYPIHILQALVRSRDSILIDKLKQNPAAYGRLVNFEFANENAGEELPPPRSLSQSSSDIQVRRPELKALIRILLQRSRNSVLVVGERGIGKSSLLDSLMACVLDPSLPESVRDIRVFRPNWSEFLKRFSGSNPSQALVLYLGNLPDKAVLCLEDFSRLSIKNPMEAWVSDFRTVLDQSLDKGTIRLVATATPEAMERGLREDPLLERYFQFLRLREPTPSEAVEILKNELPNLERHHGVRIDDSAVQAAVELSVRYLPEQRLPGKALDLLDRAASTARLRTLSPSMVDSDHEVSATESDVIRVVSALSSAPVDSLRSSGAERVLALERDLRVRIVGQDAAIDTIVRIARVVSAGLSKPGRPLAVLLFVGPTGVGKTELAKALARALYDSDRALIRFDMSEYQNEQSLTSLIGAPRGYVGYSQGGELTRAVRDNPYSVVLFDEIEKAHKGIYDIFLQIFDDGRLRDSHGAVADFTRTIVILTSNLGAGTEWESLGGEVPTAALRSHFRLELLNRISEIVAFRSLDESHVYDLIRSGIREVQSRLLSRRIVLKLTDSAMALLAREGFSREFGARHLERAIERLVVQAVASAIVDKRITDGDTVVVDAVGEKCVVRGDG